MKWISEKRLAQQWASIVQRASTISSESSYKRTQTLREDQDRRPDYNYGMYAQPAC